MTKRAIPTSFRLPSLHPGWVVFLGIVLFVFVSGSWARCSRTSVFVRDVCDTGSDPCCLTSSAFGYDVCNVICDDVWENGSLTCVVTGSPSFTSNSCGVNPIPSSSRVSALCCDNKCEADSIACLSNPDAVWNSEECLCEEEPDSSVCDEYRQKCADLGGDFDGTVYHTSQGDCCSGTCNLCGKSSMDRLKDLKRDQCCEQNLAPPEDDLLCETRLQSGCGFTTSQFNTRQNEWECQDPNLDPVTMDRFVEKCASPGSSSAEGGSSSSEGSSSSSSEGSSSSIEGLSSSGGGDGGCPECPLLDSIKDTLYAIHVSIEDIYTCLSNPVICSDYIENPFQFDTAWTKYLRPFFVEGLAVDSAQLLALLHLDTNQLKLLAMDSLQLRNDSIFLYSDSLTRQSIAGASSDISTSISTHNDSTRKWLRKIADDIGVSTDSLISHLDSIVRSIPDSILDSIVKYQSYSNDNFDSVLYGKGKGFSLVDSLIDSTVKYFQDIHVYDSIYREKFGELPGDIAIHIESILGYGDTGSSSVASDLGDIRASLDGLGDSIGGSLSGFFDTAMYGGNYGPRTVDTAYGSYINTMSNRYSNLAKNASGGTWADSATLETVFEVDEQDTVGNSPSGQDSTAEVIYSYLGDSAQIMLSRAKDSLLQDTSLLRAYYDTLKTEMQIWNFDSIFIAPIREVIPDNNSCPEDCFKGQFDLPFARGIAYDYGLCRRWPFLANQDIFVFIRAVLRLFTAISCVFIGMWAIAGRKD